MRNGYKKIGKLYAVGLGPGQASLVTLRAKELLDKTGIIFVPKARLDSPSLARSIVTQVSSKKKQFIELTFPMSSDKAVLNKHWNVSARIIAGYLNKGKNGVFVTIGDPFIYSTYIYLLKILKRDFPDIEVETIPGVSAFNAASARAGWPLVEANEKLAVVPATASRQSIKKALLDFDTVVLMKIGSRLGKAVSLLKELGLAGKAVLVQRAGYKDEKIVYNLSSLRDKKAGYLSIIIVKR